MIKIEKIVFEDKTEINRLDFKGDFEEEILNHIDSYDIKRYAEWELDLIEKSESHEYCDCDRLDDAADKELIDELKKRGLSLSSGLLEDNLSIRFQKIIERINPIYMDSILTELEKTHNIV
ncbi:hypothetical protein [Paenimyroides ceti]